VLHNLRKLGPPDLVLSAMNHSMFNLEFALVRESVDKRGPPSQADCYKVRVGKQHADTICRENHGEVRSSLFFSIHSLVYLQVRMNSLTCCRNHRLLYPMELQGSQETVSNADGFGMVLRVALLKHMQHNPLGLAFATPPDFGISIKELLKIREVRAHPLVKEYAYQASDPMRTGRVIFDWVMTSQDFDLYPCSGGLLDLLVMCTGRVRFVRAVFAFASGVWGSSSGRRVCRTGYPRS